MGILEALQREQTASQKGPPCSIGQALERLSKDDAADLTEALNSDMYATVISRALKSEGHDVGPSAVQRHRKGDCHCGST